jgi:glycosyltransferase involved in cell wall biosynthesis
MPTFLLDARTATPHFPGIGRYVANLAPAMAAQLEPGETLVILHPRAGAACFDTCAGPQVRLLESAVSPFVLRQQWQIPRLLRNLLKAKTANAHNNNNMIYHSAYYLMPYSVRMPTVLTFYDLIPLRYPAYVSRRTRALFRLTMGMALTVATHILAISAAARQDLIESFHVPPEKVTTTLLAPDPHFQPQSPEEIARVRSRYMLPASFLLSVGINKPHKNLVALVEAFDSKPELTAHSTLVFAGPWDERYPQAKATAVQLQLGDRVRFLGPIDDADLPGLYAAATAFVFPSQYEGFGLPVLEAMACGTPVACSNATSLPEVAGDAALLFDPAQPDAIAGALARLIDDAALRDDLRIRGLQRASCFTWQAVAARTLAVYRALGDGPRQPIDPPRQA